jgi:hypothetical protein
MWRSIWFMLLFALPAFAAEGGTEVLPPGAKVQSLRAEPIELRSRFASAQLVVQGQLANGETIDVTRIARISYPAIVAASANGLVRAVKDGTGTIQVALQGAKLDVPVTVKFPKSQEAISFVKDVQPVLSKLGCNAGTCHGSAQGKNGFKLSLRGYDPIFDHRALTDDLEGRRFNRADPDKSLMLLKPVGAVAHAGGVVMQPDDSNYRLIREWISQGVKQDLAAPRVKSITVAPAAVVLNEIGTKQQFRVVATYTDGSQRDVSADAFIESSNSEVVTVDKTGLLSSLRRGEATMLARYEGAYAAANVVVMGDRSGFEWVQRPVHNFIDELVDAKLKKVKIQASELCDDAEYLRRVSIDLTGLPPTADEVASFLADKTPSQEKRNAIVSKLIGSENYIDHWTNKWGDLLQINRKFLGDKGATALRQWVRDAISKNMPYNQFAYEILTASGSNAELPQAGYYKILRTPDAVMENTTQLFLAIRFNCNKCHDHPFEKWTQDQYYETAAFFAQVNRKEDPKYKGQKIGGTAVEGAKPLVEIIEDSKAGEVTHERTGQVAPPKFPFTHSGTPKADLPRRVQLAQWITAKENPYFAKSYVNRIWSYLLGVGIIEPIDDIRAGNPATNPELLDRLTKEFIESGFNTSKLMATIVQSRTYQLSIKTNAWNKGDELNYSHALPRRLPAEVLFDSIHRVTGAQSRLPGVPAGSRAAQLVDSNIDLPGSFLELFGKPVRESACECERSNTMMLGPVLAMVNGPIVADAIKDPNNALNKFVEAEKNDERVVKQIYLAVLNRMPTAQEMDIGLSAIKDAKTDLEFLRGEYQKKKTAFDEYGKTVDGKLKAYEDALRNQKPTRWEVLTPSKVESKNGPTRATVKAGATLSVQKDGSILATGKIDAVDIYTVEGDVKFAEPITAMRLEALADPTLPGKGPGRSPNGNFVLNELKLTAKGPNESAAKPVRLVGAQATFQQANYPAGNAVDNDRASGWAISPRGGQNHSALFKFQQPVQAKDGVKLSFSLEQEFGQSHVLGKFRISVTTDKNPSLQSTVPADVVAILQTPAKDRTPKQTERIRELFIAQDAEYQRLLRELPTVPPADSRVLGAQDLTWALMNSPSFLFNR